MRFCKKFKKNIRELYEQSSKDEIKALQDIGTIEITIAEKNVSVYNRFYYAFESEINKKFYGPINKQSNLLFNRKTLDYAIFLLKKGVVPSLSNEEQNNLLEIFETGLKKIIKESIYQQA